MSEIVLLKVHHAGFVGHCLRTLHSTVTLSPLLTHEERRGESKRSEPTEGETLELEIKPYFLIAPLAAVAFKNTNKHLSITLQNAQKGEIL